MDINLISELATAVIDWTAANAPEMIPAQQPFGAHSADPTSKTFGNNSKPENVSTSHDVFAGHTNMTGFYNPNPVLPPNTEQVPMDDYDPLETFTFWDGDTFYCNQECDANCAVSPEMTADSEMMFLPDYLGNEDSVTRDDLFQIRDLGLLHNPTLAELNSCGETLFDYSAENNYMSDDSSYLLTADVLSKSLPPSESHFMNPTGNLMSNNTPYSINVNCLPGHFAESRNNPQTLLSSSCPVPSRVIPCPQYLSAYNEKLILCPQNSPSSDSFLKKAERCESQSPLSLNAYKSTESVFSAHNLPVSDLLSSSAPPDVTMATHFPKIKVESPSPSAGFKSAEKSLSGFSSLSLSNDDESGSYFDDSEHDDDDDDFSSDEDLYQYDSDDMFSTSWPPGKDTKSQQRKHRYFWQYNLQSRGVKSQNLLPRAQARDPYILNDALDPVFSEECTLPVKHSGKARRGDGNDLTPNPRKLFSIGVELKKLNRLIYNMNPVNEFSVQTKPLSRKEKNKLASRVCRLKKKAQHEANKIKLYGLQQEHKRLLTVLVDMKRLIRFKIEHLQENKSVPSFQKLENYLIQHEPYKVAENTAEFVNEVLEKISKGEPDGGLGKL